MRQKTKGHVQVWGNSVQCNVTLPLEPKDPQGTAVMGPARAPLSPTPTPTSYSFLPSLSSLFGFPSLSLAPAPQGTAWLPEVAAFSLIGSHLHTSDDGVTCISYLHLTMCQLLDKKNLLNLYTVMVKQFFFYCYLIIYYLPKRICNFNSNNCTINFKQYTAI